MKKTKYDNYEELRASLNIVEEILNQLTVLDQSHTEKEIYEKIPSLLASLGKYTMAERVYIFDYFSEKNIYRDSFEWCEAGINTQIANLQIICANRIMFLHDKFQKGEAAIIDNNYYNNNLKKEERKYFDFLGIEKLVAVPIFMNRKLSGFIGMSNPRYDKSEVSIRLLMCVAGHLGSLCSSIRNYEKLHRNYNELKKEKKILDILCVDFTSVYCIDLKTDSIEKVASGSVFSDDFLTGIPQDKINSYSYRIMHYYNKYVVKETANDFLEILNPINLMKHLKYENRLTYHFRAKPNPTGKEYFEIQLAKLDDDNGNNVAMCFRYIDDIVMKETRHQKKLEKTLEIVNLNNEIISAISKLYWLILRINLDTDKYEEISSQKDMHRLTGRTGISSVRFEKVVRNVVAPEYKEFMQEFFDTTTLVERMKDKDTIAAEYMNKSGNWHMARFIVKKRDNNNNVTNVLYVEREINEQKQQEFRYKEKLIEAAEEAKRANIAKTDFLRRMSHDIRTPINGIQGMIKIAEYFSDDMNKQIECRSKIKKASDFLLQLVNDVLDMNKLESGEIKLEKKPFDFMELLFSVENIIQMQCEENGLDLCIDSSGIIHNQLIGSPIHLQQILQNITSNAVKYNREHGSIHLKCRELYCKQNTVYFEIICEDTGIGMSPEFQKHAFEPFSQESQNARTTYAGTGLGLAICKELTEKMKGTIELKSELNVGTTFKITLPIELDEKVEEKKVLDSVNNSKFSFKGKRVLLAEDNELNMEIAKFVLENKGMIVTHTWNGEETFQKFIASKEGYYDLILMDIMMPIIDGLETTKMIRQLNRSDAKKVPIFAMSANAFADDITQSLNAGMNGHFSKPLEIDKLLKTLEEYFINN